MANEIEGFLQQLFKKYKIDTGGKNRLFDEFAKDERIIAAFNQIQLNQNIMRDQWQLKVLLDDIRQTNLVMPNGTAGKEYSFTISLSNKPFNEISSFELVDFETTGLSYDPDSRVIAGVPEASGEYQLSFNFQLTGSDEWYKKNIKFVVNPNPKSLWKDLPSDTEDQYWKPDTDKLQTVMVDRCVVAASKRGRSHAHEGKFRDDHFAIRSLDATGWGIIAVSDGAGSAKSSRRGSVIACDAVLDYFEKTLTAEDWAALDSAVIMFGEDKNEVHSKNLSQVLIGNLSKAAYAAHKNIAEFAMKQEVPAKDFSATLLFSLIKKFPFGYCIASFGVGDGGIGLFDSKASTSFLLTIPDGGEYAGQTRFITMPEIFKDENYFKRFSIKVVEDFTALILMTDGITDPKFQTDSNLGKFEKWQALWDDLGGTNDDSAKVILEKDNTMMADELLAWLDFWSPGNHDDRTIAVIF